MTTEPGSLAPVVIFAYARADHLRRTVESLLANPEAATTDVAFYCDAARSSAERPMVDAVRAYVDSLDGFRSITRVYREGNMGLKRSVLAGVSDVLEVHGRVIVLEDDLVLSPHFLRYMNDGLDRYAHDQRVASIHGYSYPVDVPLPETFFLRGADCWGWATWSRAWSQLELDGARLLAELESRGLARTFDFDWQFPYTGMLRDQVAGRNSSWAILWHASCFLKGLLTLYPGRSLVENIGNDSSGTHCGTNDTLSSEPSRTRVAVDAIPVEASAVGRDAFVAYFGSRRTWPSRVKGSVKRMLASLA